MRHTVRISPARMRLLLELSWMVCVCVLALHFVSIRIDSRTIPHGDEGSWMSVAAELSRGNGFTTRWLEYPFLEPFELPRPDDFRYPGLVTLLAAAFALFGTTYTVALHLVAGVFFCFILACYAVIRRSFGARTACATLPLLCFSPLRLMYASEVYSEGLFGLGTALVIAVSAWNAPRQKKWWVLTGATLGVLYLIRPNAILFSGVFVLYGIVLCLRKRVTWQTVAAGSGVMLLVMAPWLLRTAIVFGNPFHMAGSAGLLYAQASDPMNLSLAAFTNKYGAFYFVKTTLLNATVFFRLLHEQEHGLELIPLVACSIAIIRRKPFWNAAIAGSFFITLLACFYKSAGGNWAGVRYFSSLLPFVYAYGIHQMVHAADLIIARAKDRARPCFSIAGIVAIVSLLVAPIYYPTRFFERHYASLANGVKEYAPYYEALSRQLGNDRYYYAGSLAHINFPTGYNCIGIQHHFNENDLRRTREKFNPTLLALTAREMSAPYFNGLMNTLKKEGYRLDPYAMPDSFAVLVRIADHEKTN
ncbi:MAG: glycosyltransferase family 39 protein [Chitinispirillaceae bacterium]|nr:glycosyltransferase family 39 protein [Chitinispirillaceae bacterium]